MTLIRKWALALCLVLLYSSYSNAQNVDSTTGNLVNFTSSPTATTGNWVNGVYVNQLCFQAGEPGNCGPYPSIRAASGSINFSYGQVNLNQVVNINHALSEAGTGVQLSGFNFGFRAKNGNGWDDGRQDFLAAYVNIYNSGAKLIEHYDYTQYTNRKYNWSDFNFTETFSKPYDISKLGAAQFGFVGKDNNFWAGNYGPEIMNVSFSLNYRVDPCVANPASSPTCPGFNNLIKSTNVVVPSGISIAGLTTNDAASSGTPIVNVGGAQLSTTGAITAPDNVPQVLRDVQAVTQQSQPVQIQQQSNKSAPNMSLIMNLIGQIQAADKSTQAAAVKNANQVAATSSARAQEQAMATVDNLNTMSMSSGQLSQNQLSQTVQSSMMLQQSNISSFELLGPNTLSSKYNDQQAETNSFQIARIESRSLDTEVSTMSTISSMSRGTSITELSEVKANIETNQTEQQTETVKKNVQPNELAGGVDIAAMAIQPKGFDVYATTIMKDGAFYAPKDIYGNQKTIDNARALRSLSSDRLHQDMIDLQYRR